MNVKVTFNIVGPDISCDDSVDVMDQAGERLFDDYRNKSDDEQIQLWDLDVNNLAFIKKAISEIKKHLLPNSQIQEVIFLETPAIHKVDEDWFLVLGFADDASRAEITHHTDSYLTCPACGNRYQNPRFVPALKPAKLPVKPKLMTFYGPLKLFCRPKFIDKYKQSGLTGMSFIDWEETDKHGIPLHLISVRRHQWQDRTGVCDKCEMKTNVTTSWGLFNTHEQFKYDIQYLNTFDDEAFILSRRAVEFFKEISSYMRTVLEDPPSAYPIMPGYLEDIVWPQPRLCTPDNPPVYMLRSSWPAK